MPYFKWEIEGSQAVNISSGNIKRNESLSKSKSASQVFHVPPPTERFGRHIFSVVWPTALIHENLECYFIGNFLYKIHCLEASSCICDNECIPPYTICELT